MNQITSKTKYLSIILIVLFSLFEISVCADYLSEKTVSSGDSLILNNQTYNVSIGNDGNKLKIADKYINKGNCKKISGIKICLLENISESSVKISLRQESGELYYFQEQDTKLFFNQYIETYVGHPVKNVLFLENTGNKTLNFSFKRDFDKDFYIYDGKNCRIKNNTIYSNGSLEKDEYIEISYYFLTEDTFDSRYKLSELRWFDGVKDDYVALDNYYIYSGRSFRKNISISKSTLNLSENTTISIQLNNTLTLNNMSYLVEIDLTKLPVKILSQNKLISRNGKYVSSGNLKTSSGKRFSLTMNFNKSGIFEMPVRLKISERNNGVLIDYDKTSFVSVEVFPKESDEVIVPKEQNITQISKTEQNEDAERKQDIEVSANDSEIIEDTKQEISENIESKNVSDSNIKKRNNSGDIYVLLGIISLIVLAAIYYGKMG